MTVFIRPLATFLKNRPYTPHITTGHITTGRGGWDKIKAMQGEANALGISENFRISKLKIENLRAMIIRLSVIRIVKSLGMPCGENCPIISSYVSSSLKKGIVGMGFGPYACTLELKQP